MAQGNGMRSAVISVISATIAIALSAPGRAGEGPSVCRLDQSGAPYSLTLTTSAGELVVDAERRGDTVLIDGGWASGRTYHLDRRNGFDVRYQSSSRSIETVFPEGLTDISIAAAKPSEYRATSILLWDGKVTEVLRPVTKATYLGEEPVRVGACTFQTIHLVEEPKDAKPTDPVVTTQRWFSPGLNMNLRMVSDRRETDGTSKRVLTSEAVAIAERPATSRSDGIRFGSPSAGPCRGRAARQRADDIGQNVQSGCDIGRVDDPKWPPTAPIPTPDQYRSDRC
ncbi:hypothetical protein [Methylobacterium sp. WL6]|uniref:hypothetical protein n=1 Tax=Methylobacterium sp. WL6 TaxID=2603901 RepID=UPI0011C9E053|nr:hypothetical protein [Methylobacterium sp. WL6]TXN73046.1 hypothetical protein FV230_02815 [Methylobacterium sp. WL6]